MLPIEYLLQDLKTCLGVQDIRLPVAIPIRTFLNAASSRQQHSTLEGTIALPAPTEDQASRRVENSPEAPVNPLSQAQQSPLLRPLWQDVEKLRHATKGPGTTTSHTLSGTTFASSAGDSSSQDDRVLMSRIPEWDISIKGILGPTCMEPFSERVFADYIQSHPFSNEAAILLGKVYKDREISRITMNDLKNDERGDSDDFTFGGESSAYAVFLVRPYDPVTVLCNTSNAFQLWAAFKVLVLNP